MKNNIKKLITLFAGTAVFVAYTGSQCFVVNASGTSFLNNLKVGAASILDYSLEEDKEPEEAAIASTNQTPREIKSLEEAKGVLSLTAKIQDADEYEEELNSGKEQEESIEEEDESGADSLGEKPKPPVISIEYPDDLVMANVQDAVNVRSEPSEDSERVGKLYRDCSGRIIERRDGWTHLKSGKVDGWTKDDFLLFGDDAIELAKSVGNLIAKVHVDGLRVRKEATEDAGIWGFVSTGEELNAIEVVDDVWVSVEYEGERGYVYAEFTTISYVLDDGETMEQIKAREEKEAAEKKKAEEEKAKLTKNRGAVRVEASDEVLLGALIQCEAGNQPYEGQLAVGAVVMNRVRSGGYPGTVSGVIYASGQFTPAQNGRLAAAINGGVRASCMQAAREAIAGSSNVGGATHFRRAGSQNGIVIGAHVFW